MSLALGDISVKIVLRGISEIFLPMFSSVILMVSRLIFKSFIHLEFIFCRIQLFFIKMLFNMKLAYHLVTVTPFILPLSMKS